MKSLGSLVLGLALMLLPSSDAFGAVVRFAGTVSNYTNLVGPANPDPGSLLGQTFWIDADINNAGIVTGGLIRFNGIPGNHFSVPITGPNTGSSLAPFALNNMQLRADRCH